ncbi:MAG: efflux RND transporter permease subunit [Lachnospiraceae bacterium]|nr:efflux RND transporter permease subunit [Lachnospiraceae bacterium]
MLSAFSVKKRYTVLVGVILILVLGFVSFTKMSADLLPDINLPYVIVMTTYPGASPETVETVVSSPVEASMATISNIESIQSMSAENYSVVILEFSQKTNMDAVSLDIRESLDRLEGYWPDEVGSPMIMKLNPNMLPTMIAAVGVEGMTPAEASRFAEESIVPEIERIEGVASVSASGMVEESIHAVISKKKLDKVNARVYELIDEKFLEAYEKIEDGYKEIEDGEKGLGDAESEIRKNEKKLKDAQSQVDNGRKELEEKQQATTDEIAKAKLELLTFKSDLEAAKTNINTNLTTLETLNASKKEVEGKKEELTKQKDELTKQLTDLGTQKATLQAQYDALTLAERSQSDIEAVFADYNGGSGTLSKPDANAKLADIQAALAATEAGAMVSMMTFDVDNAALPTQYGMIVTGITTNEEYINGKQALSDGIAQITTGETQITAGIGQIDTGMVQIDAGIDQIDENINNLTMGLTPEDYVATQNSVLANIVESTAKVDAGISQVYAGEYQAIIGFATGGAKLDLTDYQLATSKAQLEEGKTKIEDTKKQLSDAREQIADGKAELEEKKEDAKKAADMVSVLSVDTVSSLLTAQNFSMPAGYVEEEGNSYLVRVGDKPTDEESLKNLVLLKIPMSEDEIITLGDVCDIFTVNNEDKVYTNVNGKHGIVLSVQKQTGYSTGSVSDLLQDRFEELRERYPDVTIILLMDQGVYIDLVMNTIFENVLIGGLLAIIVLIFFLRDIRPTLIIAISIPVSLVAAVVCMYFSGVTLNIISLSGLALGVGMLVDNSIVVIENIYRLRNLGMDAKEAAIKGAKEVAGAIFASTLTTVCVFLPIVFTEGLTRQLFSDMGLTIAFSLMASLLVALTVVPAAASGMLKKVKETKNGTKTAFHKGYEKFLRATLKVKPLVLIVAVGMLFLSAYLAYSNGFAYFPDMESPQITVTLTANEDSGITDIKEQADTLVERLSKVDDIVDIGATASATTLSMLSGASNSSDTVTDATLYVTTKEKREMSSSQLVKKIHELSDDFEGITVSVETSTMDMSALGGSGISVELKGRDLDTLYNLALEAEKIIENTEGVDEVSSSISDADPELRVHVDKEKAALKGLTVATVFMQISGDLKEPSVATNLSTATDDISIYVNDEEKSAYTREDIKNYKVKYTDDDGKEQTVALSEIADFEDGIGMQTINRKGQTRYVSVNATIKEDYNITFVSNDVRDNLDKLDIPAGCSIEYAGENEMIMDAMKQLALMLVLAVVFIYLIMVAQFQSLGSPFIIMFTMPLAFSGGLLALYFTGYELSIVAMIGFVMLAGIIVNNGIVLVDYINQRREEGLSKKDAIVDAGITRLRPVLMTALTTILALLMMAFSTKMGADMSRPLAIVVIGGMVYGTLMTLVVVPCIYDMFMREKKEPERVLCTEENK